MPRRKPTPDELERGASLAVDAVTTLLRNVTRAQDDLVEAARLMGLSWDEIAEVTGRSSGNVARVEHARRKAGR